MALGCEIELDLDEGVPSGSLAAEGVEALRIVGEALTIPGGDPGQWNERTLRSAYGS